MVAGGTDCHADNSAARLLSGGIRLGGPKERRLEPRQAQRDMAFTPHFLQDIIQRPGIALLPANTDMWVAQKSVQIPRFAQRRMIFPQPDPRQIAKQHLKIDRERG